MANKAYNLQKEAPASLGRGGCHSKSFDILSDILIKTVERRNYLWFV